MLKNDMTLAEKKTRLQRLGYRPPADVPEPAQLVLVEYVSSGRVAIIMLKSAARR